MFQQLFLALGATAEGGKAAGGGTQTQLLIMFGIFVAFYFILIFPESQRRKKLKKQLDALQQGDEVITNGGIVGIIDFIDKENNIVHLKSNDTKLKMRLSAVVAILKK